MTAGMRRLRDYQQQSDTPVGRNLTRQLKALENNAGDALGALDLSALKRFKILATEERANGKMVAPGQALGIASSVERIALAAPKAKDAGKLAAVYRASMEESYPTITAEGALINGQDDFVFSAPGLVLFFTDGVNYFTTENRELFDVTLYGASPSRSAAKNTAAIQRAINAAQRAGGGTVYFPGSHSYPVNAQLTVTGNNIKLWAPGRAKLFAATDNIKIMIAVGDIDTGADLTQANTLAADSLTGSQTVTLAAGKGANVDEGSDFVIWSQGIVPDHDAAVLNYRAEIVNAYSVAGDVATTAAPLRFDYTTADSAEVYVINWIDGFEIDGLGVDGNDQIGGSAFACFLQMSWCREPVVRNVTSRNLAQRFVRFQACFRHLAQNIRATNGLSSAFVGTGFAYVTDEQGLCQDGIIENIEAERCRHGYTTGATWTNNNATTTTVFTGTNLYGFGVPMNTIVGPGVHRNSRGAGWDTHEVGMDITFRDLKTIGSLELGFQVRSVRTVFEGDCFARDCIGSALQIGSDAQDTMVRSLRWENTNLGTTSIDWTKYSPVVDNSPRSFFGTSEGKNLLDNASFDIWDRGTGFTATGGTVNRWKLTLGTAEAVTVRRRDWTPGDRVHHGKYYLRFDRKPPFGLTGTGPSTLSQYIDDVRTCNGQRLVLSFDGRDSEDGTDVNFYMRQYFGTGGGPSADVDTPVAVRFMDVQRRRRCVVFDIPSISGKTIGTNEDSALIFIMELPVAAGDCFIDISWFKLEVAQLYTDFIPEPLAVTRDKCGRWYKKSYDNDQYPGSVAQIGNFVAASPGANAFGWLRNVQYSTRMARIPTVSIYAPISGTANRLRNITAGTDIAVTVANSGPEGFTARPTNSGDVAANNVTAGSWTAAITDFE